TVAPHPRACVPDLNLAQAATAHGPRPRGKSCEPHSPVTYSEVLSADCRLGVVCFAVLAACADASVSPLTDDDPIVVQVGLPTVARDFRPTEPLPPEAPQEPAPPDLSMFDEPCPDGWVRDAPADARPICRPWPTTDLTECGEHEARFVGMADCQPVGRTCP